MDGPDGRAGSNEAEGAALRRDLRRFLQAEIGRGGFDPRAGSWARFDAGFATRLGARGYIGVDWPRPLGGFGATALDRRIIAGELLAHGAPVRAHWAAEHLAGPLLLRASGPALQRELLPRIAAGRLSLCLGLEEAAVSPDPLAMRTQALPVEGGWRVTGRKFPVADAAEAQRMLLLARTGTAPAPTLAPLKGDERLAGLTLFLVDLALPGIAVRPLPGGSGLAEVVLDDVFLAGDRVIGPVHAGLPTWLEAAQAAFGGADGWMRDWPLLTGLVDALETTAEADATLGRLVAEAFALHAMGLDLIRRNAPPPEAALVTILASAHAAALPEAARRLLPEDPPPALARALLAATAEVACAPSADVPWLAPWRLAMRGLRPAAGPVDEAERKLASRAARILGAAVTPELLAAMAGGGFAGDLWAELDDARVLRAGLPQTVGGHGQGLGTLLALTRLAAAHAAPLPVAETMLGHYALARAGLAPPVMPQRMPPLAIGPVRCGEARRGDAGAWADGALHGRLHRVPWARHAAAMVVVADGPEGALTILAGRPDIAGQGLNQAGEPRDLVLLDAMPVLAAGRPGQGLSPGGLYRLGALFRVAAIAGALEGLVRLSLLHARQPREDGRPPASGAEVGQALARLGAEAAAVRAVLATAGAAAAVGDARFEIACASLRARIAAATGAAMALRIHGAMALDAGHPLAAFTRRLWSWRAEFGDEAEWAAQTGAAARAAGGEGLWPLIADRGRMRAAKEEGPP